MNEISQAIMKQLNEFHTYDKPYDDELGIWLHQAYADVLRRGKNVDWRVMYFSPSSANVCPRALYEKARKRRRDKGVWKPHQRRWVHIGEKVGDFVQEEFLLCERHFEKFTGNKPRFTMGLVNGGKEPAFEDFIYKQHKVEHKGETFYIMGTSDGILVDNETGQHIGLEIKSKQETPSKTSLRAMTDPKLDHVKQCICYSIMYGLDKYVIAYVNTAKKPWLAPDEDLIKTPDVRMFDVDVSERQKEDILDFFADIARRVRENDPPLPDLLKWRFNDFKGAIVKSLSDEEVEKLEMISQFVAEDAPMWQRRAIQDALEDIKRRRAALKGAA